MTKRCRNPLSGDDRHSSINRNAPIELAKQRRSPPRPHRQCVSGLPSRWWPAQKPP